MTNTNNEATIVYKEKFISANLPTKNLIEAKIEKYKLPNNEATEIALGSFMAYGPNKFKVVGCQYDVEVLMQLVKYGVIWKYDDEPDTYRLWQPNNLLEFRTVYDRASVDKPRVKTAYNTHYNDGSHTEIPEDQIVENYMTNPY